MCSDSGPGKPQPCARDTEHPSPELEPPTFRGRHNVIFELGSLTFRICSSKTLLNLSLACSSTTRVVRPSRKNRSSSKPFWNAPQGISLVRKVRHGPMVVSQRTTPISAPLEKRNQKNIRLTFYAVNTNYRKWREDTLMHI